MRKKLFIIILLAVFAQFFTVTNRVSAEELSGLNLSATDKLLFNEIPSVFSASKYEQKITDAPAKISIVTAQEIARYGYRNMADILRSLPGFHTSYDRNYSYLGVRGFSIPGDYNTKILLLINGHRINDNVFDSMYIDTAFPLNLDLIERVEVVRGPASSVYGSSAFFGVVNVITKKGRDLQGLQVSTAAGSHESYQGRLSYGRRFHNGFELLLSAGAYDSDGKSRLYYSEFDDPATNNGIASDGDDDNFENVFASLSYGDFTLTGLYSNREKGIPTAPWGVEFNDSRNRSWDEHWYVDLFYEHTLANDLEITARVFYDYYSYEGDYVYDYRESDSDPADIVINKDWQRGAWWGGEIHLMRRFFSSHLITAGAELRDSLEQKQKNYDIYGTWLDLDNDVDTWGVFIQDEWSITDQITLSAGIRYDDNDTFGSTGNPRCALIWSPYENTNLKIIYGEAFRAPSVYELYYHDGYSTTKPSPGLDPETITSYEAIWEQKLNANLRSSVSIFYNDIEDLIVYALDSEDELYYLDNRGDAEAFGVECTLEGKWESGWISSLSYTWQQAENQESDEHLPNYPSSMVKYNLITPLFADIVGIGFEMQYESGRKTIYGEDDTDDIYLANLTLFNRDIIDGLAISAGIYNLFDDDYSYPGSAEHLQDEIEQNGRTYRLKIDYTF